MAAYPVLHMVGVSLGVTRRVVFDDTSGALNRHGTLHSFYSERCLDRKV